MGYKETLERMHSGKVFYFEGEELMAQQAACLDTLYDFNHTRPSEGEKRAELMKKVLATAGHPVCPELRRKQAQFNLPVHIGENVWLGAGVIVLPGVTIGENSVIGAGSVVTRDIPANVVAVGNPCRVLREITDRDREYYYKNRKIDID